MQITYGDHADQFIEFFGSEGPLVTLIHGGYWKTVHTLDHMRPLAQKLAASGFKVANIEYRREPGNPQVTVDDVNAAMAKLSDSIAIIGFSVGGQLAAICNSNVHKLILLAPVTDLEKTKSEGLGDNAVVNTFGDLPLAAFDPIKKSYDAHIYVIHGDADDRVPLAHSREFAKAKKAALMEISGADHFAMIDPDGLAFELILRTLLSK